MLIRAKVHVIADNPSFVVCQLHRERAALQLAQGIVRVVERDKAGRVKTVQIAGRVPLDARPGSLGIRVEELSVGHVYQHRRTWEQELAA